MNSQELLQRMRNVYAKFESYSDAGTVEISDGPGLGLEFQTHFKRPMNFHFQWLRWHPHFGKTQPADENTIWTNGESFTSNYHNQIKHPKNLSLMVAGANGISKGSVHLILNILAPDCARVLHPWYAMTTTGALAEDLVNDIECFHIVGKTENSPDTQVWVEKNGLLVRRLKKTTVITEELSEKMRAEQLSDSRLQMMRTAAAKVGLSKEQTEMAMATVASGFKPRTYFDIYEFKSITVNEPINDSLFTR